MDEALATAEAAAKSAKRALVLTTLAVAVAVVVLAIDHGIKRGIVDEAQKARGLLAELRDLAAAQTGESTCGTCGRAYRGAECQICKGKEVSSGTEAAGEGGADSGAVVGAADGLVHDAPTGAANGKAPRAPVRAPARKPAGTSRRAPRNG